MKVLEAVAASNVVFEFLPVAIENLFSFKELRLPNQDLEHVATAGPAHKVKMHLCQDKLHALPCIPDKNPYLFMCSFTRRFLLRMT